jgi:hypothetical protein
MLVGDDTNQRVESRVSEHGLVEVGEYRVDQRTSQSPPD